MGGSAFDCVQRNKYNAKAKTKATSKQEKRQKQKHTHNKNLVCLGNPSSAVDFDPKLNGPSRSISPRVHDFFMGLSCPFFLAAHRPGKHTSRVVAAATANHWQRLVSTLVVESGARSAAFLNGIHL
jgi:hypothetical protein